MSKLASIASWCVLVFLLTRSVEASAQDRTPKAVSLEQAMAIAESRAPEVVLAGHATREAAARRVGAGVIMPTNPRIQADLRPPITGGTIGDVGYSAILEAPFEVFGAPGARVREAERYADLSRAELALERNRARVGAWTAYVKSQVAERRIEALRVSAEIAKRIVDASTQRADLGASGDIEQSLATSDAAQIDAQIVDTIRERDIHLMELRDLLDFEADQPVELTTPLRDPEPAVAVDALIARALAARPELGVTQRRIDLLDATEERLRKETFPRVGVYAGVDAAPVSPIFGMVGLSVELPFAQRNAGPRAVVRAARDGETERLDLIRRRIAREVTATLASYDARRAELEALTTRALPTAQRTLELVETGWRSGRFDIFRVATAARDVARVRSLRLDALEAAWLERISLERVTGASAQGSGVVR